nr:putative reverse transcriptase domain-containing protein [Tanacetum cinerariifolium]
RTRLEANVDPNFSQNQSTKKIVQIKNRLLTARSRQKSYADVRRKPMEFSMGYMVMLKVSPCKGVICFGKHGKLSPRYVAPFKIIDRVVSVAYKLELPRELQGIHNTFHVSNLKKCLADKNLIIPLEEIQLDDKLHFIEEPVEIMDFEVNQLNQSRIPIVKVRWNSQRGPEFTWEREDFFNNKYPHLFSNKRKTSTRNQVPGWNSLRARGCINIDYANIFWEDLNIKLKKKQRKKVFPYTRFLSLLIMHKMKEDYGANPGAQTRHKKPLTFSKQPSVSSKKAKKGRSSKAPTGFKTGHSRKRKESSLTMDLNPSQPLVYTPVDTELHKKDQQATGSPTSLGVTKEERANPQLSSGASSTAIHCDKEEASTAIHGDKEEASSTIKLEDFAKLVSQIQPSFKDMDSPEVDPVIIVDRSDEDETIQSLDPHLTGLLKFKS